MTRLHLGRRLVLEALVRVADGAGGYASVWQPVGTVWADVRVGKASETGGVETVVASTSYRITVRGQPDGSPARPKAGQRFRDASRSFAIVAVSERDARGHYLTCFATEEVLT